MIVTKETKYSDFENLEKYLKDEAVASLKKAAEWAYMGVYELTFGQFLRACDGDFSGILGDLSEPTVLQVYWIKRFEDFKVEFGETLKAYQVPLTAKQKMAADGLPKQTFAESMLIFARSYFGLHSFSDAEGVTIGDLLIAKKDVYISTLFERKYQKLQMSKS